MTLPAPWSFLTPQQLNTLRQQVSAWLTTSLIVRWRSITTRPDGTTVPVWTEQPAQGFVTPRRAINNPKALREQEAFNVDVWVYLAHPVTVQNGDQIVYNGRNWTVVFAREPNPLFQLVGITGT